MALLFPPQRENCCFTRVSSKSSFSLSHKACLISPCKHSPATEMRSQAVKRQQHAD